MLKKITFKVYALASAGVFVFAYAYQLSLHQDCGWDGCFAAKGYTFIGSLFGLPALVAEVALLVGVLLWIARGAQRKASSKRR